MSKIGRNDPCHCQSGKKYKKCCLPADESARAAQRAQEHVHGPGCSHGHHHHDHDHDHDHD